MSTQFMDTRWNRVYGYEPPFKPACRQFVAYVFWLGFDCIQLGAHVCVSQPNIEIHLPFCFIRVGWVLNPAMPDDVEQNAQVTCACGHPGYRHADGYGECWQSWCDCERFSAGAAS